ncbi:MAG: GntR family transcriptional regulator, partial [Propionicimonas sp.]
MTVHAVPTALPIALDRMSPVPLYHQLFEQFVAALEQGALRPGDTLEREDLLADRLDIARPTLRRALSDLAALGLLVRSRGRGTV